MERNQYERSVFVNEITIFNSQEFGNIRTVTIDGEPWLSGKDVAEALGYKNTKDAVLTHVDEEDRRIIQRSEIATLENHIPKDAFPVNFVSGDIPNRGMTIINESGLYALIFGSHLESAQRFKRWVTSEVLPAIRKTGGYQKQLSPVEMMRLQLGMIDDHESRIENLENNMVIDYGQQQVLGDAVNKTVINVLGGKNSSAYKELGRKVFAECNGDLKRFFHVNARNNIPKLRFEDALEYAKNWHPCMNTQMAIDNSNMQLDLPLVEPT